MNEFLLTSRNVPKNVRMEMSIVFLKVGGEFLREFSESFRFNKILLHVVELGVGVACDHSLG